MEDATTDTVCRDLLHAWTPSTVKRLKPRFERILRCDRCQTEKIQVLDADGYILSSRYKYSTDYPQPKGSGRLTREARASLRLANLKGKP